MPPKPKTTRWSKVHKAASNKLFALGAAKGGADHLRVMRDDFEHIKAVYQAEVSKGSVLSQIPYKNFRINFAKAANAYSGYLSMNGIRLGQLDFFCHGFCCSYLVIVYSQCHFLRSQRSKRRKRISPPRRTQTTTTTKKKKKKSTLKTTTQTTHPWNLPLLLYSN